MTGWTIYNNDMLFGDLKVAQQAALKSHNGVVLYCFNGEWFAHILMDWRDDVAYRAIPAELASPPAHKPRGDMPAGDMTIREAFAMHVFVAEYGMSAEDVDIHNVVAAVDRMLVALEQNND
jgi:hypothetical protein